MHTIVRTEVNHKVMYIIIFHSTSFNIEFILNILMLNQCIYIRRHLHIHLLDLVTATFLCNRISS